MFLYRFLFLNEKEEGKMKNILSGLFVGIFMMCLGVSTYASDPLVVGVATSHLNNISGAVRGVLVTPTGRLLFTDPMGPFDHHNMLVEPPEIGVYQVYFEVLQLGAFRLCPIVGGVGMYLCGNPEKSIAVTPTESRIQSFPAGKKIEIGSISQPPCTFEIFAEDLIPVIETQLAP